MNLKNFINIIWLTPYMDKIMYEGQSIKRNFVDKMISQNNKFFNKTLSAYKNDIQERLSILKNSKDDKWLNIIEKKIAQNIFDIFSLRREYAKNLNQIIDEKLNISNIRKHISNFAFDVGQDGYKIEMFALLGQSNMVGRDQFSYDPKDRANTYRIFPTGKPNILPSRNYVNQYSPLGFI